LQTIPIEFIRWNSKNVVEHYLLFTFPLFVMWYKNKKIKQLILSSIVIWLSINTLSALYIQSWDNNTSTWDVQITSVAEPTLSEQLFQNKANLEKQIATIYNTVYNDYLQDIQEYNNLPNYQSLICLGIINQDNILENLGTEIDLIRKSILNEYVELNANIFNLINKYSVWLIDNIWFSTQKTKLTLDLQSYYNSNNLILSNLEQRYSSQITQIKNQLDWYITQNKDLLQNLNTKTIAIQDIVDTQEVIQENIFQINNALNLNQDNFLEDLKKHSELSLQKLSQALDASIYKYLLQYNYITDLPNILTEQKNNIIKIYHYDTDNQSNQLFGYRYDQKEYEDIQNQIQTLKDTFYQDQKLSCNKVLSTTLNLDGYVKTLQDKIFKFNTKITNWLKLFNTTGADIQLKKEILTSAQNIYASNFDKNLKDFNEFADIYIKDKSYIYEYLHKNIKFNKVFEEWESNEEIKTLQALLQKIWFYTANINGIYDQATIDAVYKLQLEWWILKWYEDRPDLFGYFGPSTRAYAKKRLAQINTLIETTSNEKMTATETTVTNETNTTIINQKILAALYKLEQRFSTKETFIYLLNWLLTKIDDQLDSGSLATSKQTLYQSFKVSIQIYLNENQ